MHTPAWYGFLPRLRPDYDVLLWDYPGQCRSTTADVPYHLDRFGTYLLRILDRLKAKKIHLVGISYGGFVALEFARQYHDRLHTMAISGILLSREKLFDMYQELSLRFYAGGPDSFEQYTYYMYEKIFGEAFAASAGDSLAKMRQSFCDRYRDRTTALVRLTKAQNPATSPARSGSTTHRWRCSACDSACTPPGTSSRNGSALRARDESRASMAGTAAPSSCCDI